MPRPGRSFAHIIAVADLGRAGEDLLRALAEEVRLLDAEVWQARSRCRLAACPTGETSPGPCQAVRTPKNSQKAASLRAGVIPPMSEIWTRMKSISRSWISGRYLV